MTSITRWQVFELEFLASADYVNPYLDVDLKVAFTAPSGGKMTVTAFWDGGNVWKARFAPPLTGRWTWSSLANPADDKSLHGLTGSFDVDTDESNNPIYQHGFLKVGCNDRGFEHADGQPFFWLADTVWSSPARTTVDEWETYTSYRSRQGFNVLQVNALPQHDASGEDYREPFALGSVIYDLKLIKPDYFKYLDQLVELAAKKCLFTAMVVLWCDYVPGTNPSWGIFRHGDFKPELAERYATYLAARYAAFGVIWVITGDTDLDNTYSMSVYDAAAQAIRSSSPYPGLMTAHLNGSLYSTDVLNSKSWLDFHMIQSSHNHRSDQAAIYFAKMDRAQAPARPVLNGEPPYEKIGYHMLPERISREFVRQVGWASIMAGANAGITYGAHGLWSWHRTGEVFKPALAWQMPLDWRDALKLDGAEDYARMKRFFEKLSWWDLEPVEGVFQADGSQKVSQAVVGDLTIAYLSEVSDVLFIQAPEKMQAEWFNPENGETIPAVTIKNPNGVLIKAPKFKKDAVLIVG